MLKKKFSKVQVPNLLINQEKLKKEQKFNFWLHSNKLKDILFIGKLSWFPFQINSFFLN
jgi:hypothetical protein